MTTAHPDRSAGPRADPPDRDAIRIIARRVPWPSLSERPDRAGLHLRWDALTEAGALLLAATTHPFLDGAHVLATGGADPEAPTAMRYEGETSDALVPMPLRIPAAAGAKRAADRERVRNARSGRDTPGLGGKSASEGRA